MTSPEDVVTLSVERSGSGPLAVLLHGITENRHSLDPVIPALAEHFTVLSVDLRGHGKSPHASSYDLRAMAADVADAVSTAGFADVEPLVIGHSLGGAVAAVYAGAYPVFGVINVDQPLDLAGFQAALKPIEPLLRSEAFIQVITGMFGQMYGALPAPEVERISALRRPEQPVVLGIWDPILTLPVDQLATLVDSVIAPSTPYPYLEIHGSPVGPGYSDWLRERIPGAVVEDWGGVGHYPHLVEPERFVSRVLAFSGAVG